VRIERAGLPVALMARGEPVVVGQLAVAVGSPFGFEESVTSGVISAVGRILPREDVTVEVLQTDAAINPGNSGGALADRFGRVIGINIAAREGGRTGLGFAVPIDVALDVAELLERGEEPPPVAFLGVSGSDPTSGPAGALITEVTPQGAAEEAGLEAGDLVRSVDGLPIAGMDALVREIRSRAPGDAMTLIVLRDDEELEIVVVLGDPP
jgi:putative serine protease PepD